MTTTVENKDVVTFPSTIELTTIVCGRCGGTYAIGERFRKEQQRVGGEWTCPYCKGGWGYPGDTENDRLKRALTRERAACQRAQDERDTAERQRRGQKAAKMRLARKLAKGLCPCCGRQFKDLHRHMASKHPKFGETPQRKADG